MELKNLDRIDTAPNADLSIRLSTADTDDGQTIRRLASLDGKTPPWGPVILAEVGGEPVAAVGLADGEVVGNPARAGAGIVAVLHLHRLEARLIGSIWGG